MQNIEYDAQPAQARKIFDAFAEVVIRLREIHGASARIELDFCPMSFDNNVAIISREGLDLSRLPAVQVRAEYADGTSRRYFLQGDEIEYTPEVVQPYVTALLYNRTAQPVPIICQVFPPACSVGVWLWLAAGLYGAYRTTQARNVGKVVWGGVTLMAGDAFLKGGGVDEIKKTLNI